MVVAALAVLPVELAEGGGHLLEPRSLAVGAAVGLLSSAIPYSFENEALRRIAPSVFGVLMSLEPGMAALAGFLVVGQHVEPRALVGIASSSPRRWAQHGGRRPRWEPRPDAG